MKLMIRLPEDDDDDDKEVIDVAYKPNSLDFWCRITLLVYSISGKRNHTNQSN
jgi:hypothetical protein